MSLAVTCRSGESRLLWCCLRQSQAREELWCWTLIITRRYGSRCNMFFHRLPLYSSLLSSLRSSIMLSEGHCTRRVGKQYWNVLHLSCLLELVLHPSFSQLSDMRRCHPLPADMGSVRTNIYFDKLVRVPTSSSIVLISEIHFSNVT